MKNFNHKKSLGQNFINDQAVIDKIVEYSNVDKETLVIEIGPGMGVLSKKLIPVAKNTILYEVDKRLKNILVSELNIYNNYELIIGDFLEQDIVKDISKYNYKKLYVVANLPYYITTPIINKLIHSIYPDKIIIMVQKEVAERFSAPPNCREYGYISVYLNSYYDINKLFDVSRTKFTPSPNVDSSVLEMIKSNKINNNREKFEQLIEDSFQYKRKNLKNNLKNYDLKQIEKILEEHTLSLTNRAENISLDIFYDIAKRL